MRAAVNRWRIPGRTVIGLALSFVVVAGALADGPNYLIVAAEDFVGSDPLDDFIAAKTAQGYSMSVYSVPSGTTRATIKAHIQAMWGLPNAPKYMLIVGDTSGDPSTGTTIPHWSGNVSGADTDMYYGCMDAGDDWYPDIFIGRFSVTSVAQLRNVVDKTLYIEAGSFPDPAYIKRAAFLATDDMSSGGEEAHDWVISNYIEPAAYEATKIYARLGGNTSDVAAAINAGSLFAVYFGHSNSSGWWDPSFDQGDVAALSNSGLYGLVFGFSCNTTHFSNSECSGETWIRAQEKGAAAYLSASTYIYYTQSPWHESQNLEKFFFQSFFVDNIWQIGPAWNAALYRLRSHYGPTNTVRDHYEMFVLLGDPSLTLPKFVLGPEPLVGVRTPNGGEVWTVGQPYDIEWTAIDDVAVVDVDIYLSTDGGNTFPHVVDTGLPNTGTYSWTAPSMNASACRIKVVANDGDGNSGEDISDANFTITPFGPVVIHDLPLDSDPGWSCEGQWAFGQPTGGGGQYGGPDPTSGHTGPFVYGYNLQGDYENSMPERHLTSGPFDCSGHTGTTLAFWRWLGVEQPTYDHAYVRVSNDGVNWNTIWQNNATISDSSWQYQEFDIATVADDQQTVYLRWTMGTSDSAWRYCGWNIDDIQISGIPMAAPGDLDCDGDVDFDDINPFVLALNGEAAYNAVYPECNWLNADCDADGDVDFDDINPFVTMLGG